MKIAFVGKGGSGKTTIAALFTRYLALRGFPVIAIDADINQHLAGAIGLSEEQARRLPHGFQLLALRATNGERRYRQTFRDRG